MIASEKEPAQKFCCWLLELDHSHIKSYHSQEHLKNIDLDNFFAFLFPPDKNERNEEMRQRINQKLQLHTATVRKIALGEQNAFDDSSDNDILKLQKWIGQYIAAHGSHTHLVEAFVREASLCAATNRDETLRSYFAVCRSVNHYDLNMLISENEKDRVRKGNSFRTKGVHGSREN